MKIRVVKTAEPGFKALMARIMRRRGNRRGGIEKRVEEIVGAVRRQGDRALLRYTRLFDKVRLSAGSLEVTRAEIASAVARVPKKDIDTLRLAAKRIAAFHRRPHCLSVSQESKIREQQSKDRRTALLPDTNLIQVRRQIPAAGELRRRHRQLLRIAHWRIP